MRRELAERISIIQHSISLVNTHEECLKELLMLAQIVALCDLNNEECHSKIDKIRRETYELV